VPTQRARAAAAPVVVAVDDSPCADDATRTAVRLARDLAAPLVFVYVRRGPSSALGEPYYQRRLDAEMRKARRALDRAIALAAKAGVPATDEELAGDAALSSQRVAAPSWSWSGRGADASAEASRAPSSAVATDRSSSPVAQRRLPRRGGRGNPAGEATLMRRLHLYEDHRNDASAGEA
jgi:hypothetical protein